MDSSFHFLGEGLWGEGRARISHSWYCVLNIALHQKACNVWLSNFVDANLELICFQTKIKHFHASKIKIIKQSIFREILFLFLFLYLVLSFPFKKTSLDFFPPMASFCKYKKIYAYFLTEKVAYNILHTTFRLLCTLYMYTWHLDFITVQYTWISSHVSV